MNTLSEIPPSVNTFVKSRKTHPWTSAAHPHVTVFYVWNGPDDPIDIYDIQITGSLLAPTTHAFLLRFGYQADEQQAFLDELAQFLHGAHPRNERQPVRTRGEFEATVEVKG